MTLPYFQPLEGAALHAHGIPDKWPMGMASRVRYSELDPLNHVNNSAYLPWFESIRVAYYKLWGVRGLDVPIKTVLRTASVEYLREMLLDEDYFVTIRTTAFRRTSFTMEYGVYAPDLRTTGTAVAVLLHEDGSGRAPIPEVAKQRFLEIDKAVQK